MSLPACHPHSSTQSKRTPPTFVKGDIRTDYSLSERRERAKASSLRSLSSSTSTSISTSTSLSDYEDLWQNNPDGDFVSLSTLEDSMQNMQRSVFERLKPLESQPGVKPMDMSGCASPGLTDELQELSFNNKLTDGQGDAMCTKPSISFACLIAMAILDSDLKRLTVSEVYEWMKKTYPYFSSPVAGTGWKNSVRHNLSLNKHFIKQVRDDGEPGGKGSYWRIRPESMPTMEITIRKQGGGQLTRQLDDMLAQSPVRGETSANSGSSNNSTPKSPTEAQLFTHKVTLPRRSAVARPKPQPSSRRLKSLDSLPSSTSFNNTTTPTTTMDDHEAAAMLCSFSTSSAPQSPMPEDTFSPSPPPPTTTTTTTTITPISPTPPAIAPSGSTISSSTSSSQRTASKRQIRDTFPSLWKAAAEGRTAAAQSLSNKRRNPSFKASYHPNGLRAGELTTPTGTPPSASSSSSSCGGGGGNGGGSLNSSGGLSSSSSMKHLTYVPSSIKRPRRGHITTTPEALFTNTTTLSKPTATSLASISSTSISSTSVTSLTQDDSKMMDLDVPKSPSMLINSDSAKNTTNANTNMNTPNALSTSTSTSMANMTSTTGDRPPMFTFSAPLSTSRYTPEGPTSRTPQQHHEEKPGGFTPPKIRRKLGLTTDMNAKMQDTTDAVAAALLGLSGGNPYRSTAAASFVH